MFSFSQFAPASFKNECLSGLTVALALVPEAVAFAFVAGVDPMVGLYAAFFVGAITALFGGRPGMISGATGAMAVVMVSLVSGHGIPYLFAAVLLAGILQILAGLFRLGKFVRLVPYPVMIGFVNGLAIVILLAQFGQFKTIDEFGQSHWLSGAPLFTMLALVAVTMGIIYALPKFTKAVPASLIAILSITGLAQLFSINTPTVIDFVREHSGNVSATLAGSWPQLAVPNVPFTLETIWIIAPYAAILAAIGLIESLLTLTVIDEMTQTRGRSNQECIGQGAANVTCAFFGAMGGCAMIGQSMINIQSGGRGRLSGLVAAFALLGFILFGAHWIEQIPLAALVGVMFMVVIGTFEWATFKMLRKVPKHDVFTIILVTIVTVFTDLAMAVFVGVIYSALVFAWSHAKRIHVTSNMERNTKVYRLHGPLFFSSTQRFLTLFDTDNDPDTVILDFADSRVTDHSAIDAINTLTERYSRQGKSVHLRHLSPDCRQLLKKADTLVEVNIVEDPTYKVVTDTLA